MLKAVQTTKSRRVGLVQATQLEKGRPKICDLHKKGQHILNHIPSEH